MKLRQIWVISNSGLQLFSYSPKYCPRCNGILALENEDGDVYRCKSCFEKATCIDTDHAIENLLKASGVYNILTYFSNFLIQEPTEFLLTNRLLWVIHYQKICHFNPPEQCNFSVLIIAEIDLSIPIMDQERIMRKFCQEVAFEFYNSCKDLIVTVNSANIQMYDQFRPLCTNLVLEFTRSISAK